MGQIYSELVMAISRVPGVMSPNVHHRDGWGSEEPGMGTVARAAGHGGGVSNVQPTARELQDVIKSLLAIGRDLGLIEPPGVTDRDIRLLVHLDRAVQLAKSHGPANDQKFNPMRQLATWSMNGHAHGLKKQLIEATIRLERADTDYKRVEGSLRANPGLGEFGVATTPMKSGRSGS